MPAIELVPVPLYDPLTPYDHVHDNLPIIGLITRIDLVNSQVDIHEQILASAIGTQGTLANFLAQSLNEDGSLKTTSVDASLHNISEHIDGNGFVRMTDAERAKLSFIADEATSLKVNVQAISYIREFVNETMVLQPSDSVVWRVSGDNVYADTNFPESVRHSHYYNVVPVPQNLLTPDYQNYSTSSVNTAYRQGSLRVYINGVRLNDTFSTYVPSGFPIVTWTLLSYTEDTPTDGIVTSGLFSLSAPISSSDNITIDFDVLFT